MEKTAIVIGQIVTPSMIRRKLGIKTGPHIPIGLNEKTGQIILTPFAREYIQSLCGKYKGRGLLDDLTTEKQRKKEL